MSVAVEGTGLGVVDAFGPQTLTGGTDNTAAVAGTMLYTDGNEYWVTIAPVTTTSDLSNWKKLTLAAVP